MISIADCEVGVQNQLPPALKISKTKHFSDMLASLLLVLFRGYLEINMHFIIILLALPLFATKYSDNSIALPLLQLKIYNDNRPMSILGVSF